MSLSLFNKDKDKSEYRELAAHVENMQKEVQGYERIFKGSRGYGFVDWDLSSNRMSWNGAFWEYLGYSEDDMPLICDPTRFMTLIHVDDHRMMEKKLREVLKGIDQGEVLLRVRKKIKGYIWTVLRVIVVRDENGWVHHISGITFDVSKLKNTERALMVSEARQERIIRSSRDGIWEWSAESGGFQYSSGCWKLLGYEESDDEIIKEGNRLKIWRARMHPDDAVGFDRSLWSHYKKRTPLDVEYRIRAKDDSWKWIRVRGQSVFDDSGKVVRISGTNMDITDFKMAESRVIHAKNQAEKANRAKSEFLSSMSHELRTPLNAILGFAKLLSADISLTSEQHTSMHEILRAGNHLLQLVNDVLDLARIEAGRMEVKKELISPVRVMSECIELVRPQAEQANISIDCQVSGTQTKLIYADEVRINQVFLNLLSNAIKYNKDGGCVRVRFEILVGETIKISIEDSGKGIAAESREDIFKPFNRLGEEGSSIEGAGIGLIITKTLVEQMQGKIDFSSEVGKGSTFWLEFSVAQSLESSALTKTMAKPKHSGPLTTPQFTRTLNVLYVEDNLANQRLMQQVLASYAEFNLTMTAEPMEGIFIARSEQPDLILLDIDLPELSGHEVVKILKQDTQTRKIPVVALSAKAMPHDVAKGRESGFDDYLTKPFDFNRFIGLCNELFAPSA